MKLNLSDQTLEKLKQLTKSSHSNFLGYTLDLEQGTITDTLKAKTAQQLSEWYLQIINVLLTHYSTATSIDLAGRLVKFKELPGGYAYDGAFIKRAIEPIAQVFGNSPEELVQAGAAVGGKRLGFGDASIEIMPLNGIPLTYILWCADELQATANILYDQSASNYLPTEDLAVLGELATIRLVEAKKAAFP